MSQTINKYQIKSVDKKVDNSESWDQNPRLLFHCSVSKSFGNKAKLSYLLGLNTALPKSTEIFALLPS